MQMSGYAYVCSGGETFDSIARELWSDENFAADLMCANPEHTSKIIFLGGEKLFIPLVDLPDTSGGTTATGAETAPWRE